MLYFFVVIYIIRIFEVLKETKYKPLKNKVMKTSTILLLAAISLCISLTSCDRRSSICINKKESIKKELTSTREALNKCDDYRRDSLIARVMVLKTEYFNAVK